MSMLPCVLSLVPLLPPAIPARAADPLEGCWVGTAGSPRDRVPLGIEVKSDASGKLALTLCQPTINMYSTPGTIERREQEITIRELGATLALHGDVLEGKMTSLALPIELRRADALPSEPSIPDLPRGPGPRWSTTLGGGIHAPVAIFDGIAYVGTTSGALDAIRVADGAFTWTFGAGRPIFGGALATQDSIYFACDDGWLRRLDRATGKERWRYDLGDARSPRLLENQHVFEFDLVGAEPVLADGFLYVGSGDGSFHSIDAATGERAWRFETRGRIRVSALIDGPRVVFGSYDGGLYSLDRATGEKVWRHELGAPVTTAPALVDGRILAGGRNAVLSSHDPLTGAASWRALYWGSWVESRAVPFEGRVYIGSSDMRRVSCYDPEDGGVDWRADVYGWSWGTPAVTEKLVYAGAAGTHPYPIRHQPGLVAIDRKSGAIAWRWVPPPSAAMMSGFVAGPVNAGDTLVIGSLDGVLYGFPIES